MVAGRNGLRGAVYQRGAVHCGKCGTPIHIQRLQALADEFSVRCPRCGHRGIYSRRAVVIEDMPERRKKPRSR
jgi:DNA-directed RNA polymerase subunit RPC12/RpoP